MVPLEKMSEKRGMKKAKRKKNNDITQEKKEGEERKKKQKRKVYPTWLRARKRGLGAQQRVRGGGKKKENIKRKKKKEKGRSMGGKNYMETEPRSIQKGPRKVMEKKEVGTGTVTKKGKGIVMQMQKN